MKFDLAYHDEYFKEHKLTHNSKKCLCRRFEDGEEMARPMTFEENLQNTIIANHKMSVHPPFMVRDPSQSEQPWHDNEEKNKEHGNK